MLCSRPTRRSLIACGIALAVLAPVRGAAAPPGSPSFVEPFAESQVQHPWVVPAATPIVPTIGTENRPAPHFGTAGWARQDGEHHRFAGSRGAPDDPAYEHVPGSAVCGPPVWNHHPGCACPWDDPLGFCHRPLCFRDDFEQFGGMLWRDARNIVNWNNAVLLGVATGGVIAIRQDLDDRVREYTARHPRRWGGFSNTLTTLGDPEVTIPVLLGTYGYSLWKQDEELHRLSGTLISAYTLTTASTLLIKAAVNTDRPSNQSARGRYGFPSYHTSSTFALAAVVDEYYGPGVGLPAYTVAGLIGWSRIDTRNHDLSDVVFGAALGFVIGKSVAGTHLRNDGRVRILPYAHPTDGTPGVMFESRF
jgi:membrane-associated phospholipid phosphatase